VNRPCWWSAPYSKFAIASPFFRSSMALCAKCRVAILDKEDTGQSEEIQWAVRIRFPSCER
jgi:hypothetical protein